MHVVVNGRRAGSVQMPPVDDYGTPVRSSKFVKPTRLGADFGSPSVTPVASPDGVTAHQNRSLDTDDTAQRLFTRRDPRATLLHTPTHSAVRTAVEPEGVRYHLPPSRLRSPARRGEVRNMANDISADLAGPRQAAVANASESTVTLQSRNNDLRGQLEAARAQLASKRVRLQMLSRSTASNVATAAQINTPPSRAQSELNATLTQDTALSPRVHSGAKVGKVNRARLKRSMLLARGLGTTRLELKQLREDVISAKQQMAQEIDAAVIQVSAAVAATANTQADAAVSRTRMEQCMDMQLSITTTLRDLVLGLPGMHLTANFSRVPSLSISAVGEWLKSLGLAEHAAAFADHAIDGKALMELTDIQLRDDLRMLKVGQRNTILAARRELVRNDDDFRSHLHQADRSRQSDGRPKNIFRPPRLQLATSLISGRRTPRSKLLSRASKAKVNARLAALNGRPESAAERQERQSRTSTMLLDMVSNTRTQHADEKLSDAGSSVGSSASICLSTSEDLYSDDFDAASLNTVETEYDYDRSSTNSACGSQAWGVMSGDDDPNVAVSEVDEEVEQELAYDSDFERMSSASSRSESTADRQRHDMHAGDDSPTTTALKVEFLAGITPMEESKPDTEIMDLSIESDEVYDDALRWSQSLNLSIETIPTPRRGDNLNLTTLSTRSYTVQEEEEDEFVDFAEDQYHAS